MSIELWKLRYEKWEMSDRKTKQGLIFWNIFFWGDKLQITLLMFRVFGFYLLRFQNLDFNPWSLGVQGAWILYPNISEFKFYPLKFGGFWILHS